MKELEKAQLLKEANRLIDKIDATIRYIVESIKSKNAKVS